MGAKASIVRPTEEEEEENAWMSRAIHALGDKRLNQIAIPGTHNSCTYSFTRASRYSVDQPGLVKWRPPWPVSYFIAQWSKTQARSIAQQLKDGIRYFDIRVGHQNKEFYSCHGMVGDLIPDILREVMDFSKRFPREVIILDLNHFYELGSTEHNTLCQFITDTLGTMMWPFSAADMTLNEAFHANIGPIVIVYHHTEGNAYNFFPETALTSPWPNTDNIRTLQEKLQDSLIKFDRESKQLFVSQCVLTPSLDTVLGGFWRCGPTSLTRLAKLLNKEVVQWISGFHKARPLNIVMMDHYHTCDIVDLIVQLNFAEV